MLGVQMSYIEARCKNCGAQLEIDESKGKGYCPHCGTLFVKEKVNHIYQQNISKTIYGLDKSTVNEYLQNGEVFLSLKEFEKAKSAFDKAIELNPADWRGWFGMVKAKTKNFTDYFDNTHLSDLKKAHSVASDSEDKLIDELYEQYLDSRRAIHLKRSLQTNSLDDFYSFSQSSPQVVKSSVVQNKATTKPMAAKKVKSRKSFILIVVAVLIALSITAGFTINYFVESSKYTYADNLTQNGVTIIEYDGAKHKVAIPKYLNGQKVVAIANNVFKGSKALAIRQIVLPKSIVHIESLAFSKCLNLEYIRLKSESPPALYNMLDVPNQCIIYVPRASLENYKSAPFWNNFLYKLQAWEDR